MKGITLENKIYKTQIFTKKKEIYTIAVRPQTKIILKKSDYIFCCYKYVTFP